MPFEADLAHALDRTTGSVEPDVSSLMSGAVERGRIQRRRRNTRILAAGAGACAVVAAAALVLPGALAGTRSGGSDLEMVALAAPRSAISGDQMTQAVEKTFPGARFSKRSGQSNNPFDPSAGMVANGGMVVDDGHGAAYVGVSAMRLKLPLQDGAGLSCEQTPARAEGDTCRLSELPDSAEIPGGAMVMYEQTAAGRPVRQDTAHRWTVTVTMKKTGAELRMVQWNSTGGGDDGNMPKATRQAPPLTEQQAVAALTGATWAPIRGAVA
ncbi:hypothetical protein [Streptomyces sp. NPDC051561]|uniref:hypothetical protein n=1 Tax=Streptomyces sp. NPDC051561 TaxID=3365658 RepID=UPI00379320C0